MNLQKKACTIFQSYFLRISVDNFALQVKWIKKLRIDKQIEKLHTFD